MALRGFLGAFLALVVFALLACAAFFHFGIPWLDKMIENHPALTDLANFMAAGLIAWRVE